jgi:hypothetical protein
MRKKIVRIAVPLVVLLIAAVVLVLNLDRVVEAGVENGGKMVPDVPTNLGGAVGNLLGTKEEGEAQEKDEQKVDKSGGQRAP